MGPTRVVGSPFFFFLRLSFEQLKKRQHISGSNSSGVNNLPKNVAAPIKCSGGTTELDAISEASTWETESTTTELHTEGSTSLAWTCVASRKKAVTPYCFCADLETVKGAVVNPEVETPSTPVSPCATSGLLAPSAVAAPIKCSGGTTVPDAISASHFGCHDRRAQCSPDVEINLYQLFGVGALAHRGLPPVRGLVRAKPLAYPALHLSAREGCPGHCDTLFTGQISSRLVKPSSSGTSQTS